MDTSGVDSTVIAPQHEAKPFPFACWPIAALCPDVYGFGIFGTLHALRSFRMMLTARIPQLITPIRPDCAKLFGTVPRSGEIDTDAVSAVCRSYSCNAYRRSALRPATRTVLLSIPVLDTPIVDPRSREGNRGCGVRNRELIGCCRPSSRRETSAWIRLRVFLRSGMPLNTVPHLRSTTLAIRIVIGLPQLCSCHPKPYKADWYGNSSTRLEQVCD